jgi:hypothetical protein
MTLDDVKKLLAVAMGYDNRNPGQLNVAAWSEAAQRGRWTLGEAVEAVHTHYATETTWLMPAHITRLVKAGREQRERFRPEPRPEPIGQARVRELVAAALPDDRASLRPPQGVPPALARRCAYCGAAPGQPCTRESRTGRVALENVHPTRAEAS